MDDLGRALGLFIALGLPSEPVAIDVYRKKVTLKK